jgi:zinc D-Ala-D-Ala carboxypeptidase
VPSHRADTPADAPTALRSRSSAHPTHPPLQRRRDLRTRAAVPANLGTAAHGRPGTPAPRQRTPLAGLEWLAEPALRTAPWTAVTEQAARTSGTDVHTVGALALDPLFFVAPPVDDAGVDDAELAGDGPLAPVQPLRRPRGKARAKAQTTRRAVKAIAEAAPRRSAPGFPQVGIAGALGIATIAVPLAGGLGLGHAARPSAGAPQPAAAAALAPLPAFPVVATHPQTALADRRLLPVEAPVTEVPSVLAARRTRVMKGAHPSRSAHRSVLPGCDGQTPDVSGVQNGRLPASMLCTLWDPKRQLRSDAAVALAKLNVLYTKRFGHPICFNDAYRSLVKQYRIKAMRGGYAARPGTSEHGWGLAVDLCDGVDDGARSATYTWLRANAAAYGWDNPAWARPGGSGPYEPWHWEFLPGEQGQSKGD